MTPPGPGRLPPADEPLDDADFGVLGDIRELFEAVDPMPADLPERIRFALALRDLEVEVARLAEEAPAECHPPGSAPPVPEPRWPAPRAGPGRRVSAACRRETRAAPRSAPATSARGCGSSAGPKPVGCPMRSGSMPPIRPWPPGY